MKAFPLPKRGTALWGSVGKYYTSYLAHTGYSTLIIEWLLSLLQVQVGLGTDVAGGYSASMLDCVRQTMIATNVCGMEPDEDGTKWKPLRCGCACIGALTAIDSDYRIRIADNWLFVCSAP